MDLFRSVGLHRNEHLRHRLTRGLVSRVLFFGLEVSPEASAKRSRAAGRGILVRGLEISQPRKAREIRFARGLRERLNRGLRRRRVELCVASICLLVLGFPLLVICFGNAYHWTRKFFSWLQASPGGLTSLESVLGT